MFQTNNSCLHAQQNLNSDSHLERLLPKPLQMNTDIKDKILDFHQEQTVNKIDHGSMSVSD